MASPTPHEPPQTARSRPWGLLVVGAAAFAVGLSVWGGSQPAPPCAPNARALADTWNDARRQTLRSAMLDHGLNYAATTWQRVEPRLDQWARDWVDAHAHVCRASLAADGQTQARSASGTACLAQARAQFDAFTTVLAEADERATRNAVTGAAALGSPLRCAEIGPPPEAKPALAPAVALLAERLDRRLHLARARSAAGQPERAMQTALAVATEAHEYGAARTEMDAQMLEAEQRTTRGEHHAAQRTLVDVYARARATHDSVRAAEAAVQIARIVGVQLRDPAGARVWVARARTHLQHVDSPSPLAQASLTTAAAEVERAAGDHAAATAGFVRALALQRSVWDPNEVRLLPALSALARSLWAQGRELEAADMTAQALRLAATSLGEDHPDVAQLGQRSSAR